jgi:hypothetical protein
VDQRFAPASTRRDSAIHVVSENVVDQRDNVVGSTWRAWAERISRVDEQRRCRAPAEAPRRHARDTAHSGSASRRIGAIRAESPSQAP